MRKILLASAILMAIGTAVWAEAERVITTTGLGVIELEPDMASIDIGVTHQSRVAEEALVLTSEALTSVIARLEEAGIAPRDMQTQGLSLQPVWSRQAPNSETPSRITGFVARNGLLIRVRDLTALGEILDTVVEDGANTFNGLRFSVQDPAEAIAAARAEAVEEAMTKARQLAAAAGVTLGPVQSIIENGGPPAPRMMDMAAARMSSNTPVAAGEVSLSAQVTMVFSILE
jgi:uncharacterized protein YggE